MVANPEKASGEGFINEFVLETLAVPPTIFNILLLIFVFFSLKGIVKFVEGYLGVLYRQYFMRQIRISNIDLLNQYSFLHFAKTDAGKIQNTFSGEVGRVNSAFKYYFKAFQYGVLVLVYLAMAFAADIRFTLMVALGGWATNFLFKFLYKRTKYFSAKYTSQSHKFQGLLIQMVTHFKYLKTTGSNFLYSKKLKGNIYDLEKTQRRLGIVESLLNSLREPLIILVVIAAIYIQVVFFGQDIGTVLFSLLLLYRALTFLMAMQEHKNFFLGVSGSLDNLEKFTSELKAGKEKNGVQEYSGFSESLTFRDLRFRYGEINILNNINLDILKNETLAIIGESGSGKSTLLSIASGLLDPSEGEFKIDDRSLQEFDLNSYKKKVGYISQEPAIFNDNIYNNVTFWAEKTSENHQRFLTAIKKAAIYDFVMQLSEKENTYLGNNGINLSGGQKQRLSIARELYKEVDILLMDEATSALDSETEAIVQENVHKLKGEFTVIVIAHRLATIKDADRIVILNEGQIEAEGTYRELLENSSHFKEMIKLQNL